MPTDPRDLGSRPDGPISGILYDHTRRMNVCRAHALAEGYEFDDRAALEGYDRVLHPWVRGWRPGEIRETLRGYAEKYREDKRLLGVGDEEAMISDE